jgi:hypothetical protein
MSASSSSGSCGPLVSIVITKDGEQVKSISISEAAAVDVNAVSLESRASNTRFEYSGRHDHGDLPLLRSSGESARLVTALQEAKAQCDEYLTQCIKEEFGYAGAEVGATRGRTSSAAEGQEGQEGQEGETRAEGSPDSPAPTGGVPKKLRVEGGAS